MYDAGFDMRSHQASHYGASQDRTNRLFTDFVQADGTETRLDTLPGCYEAYYAGLRRQP